MQSYSSSSSAVTTTSTGPRKGGAIRENGGTEKADQRREEKEETRPGKKRRQADGTMDEIDALFDAAIGSKKVKRAKLITSTVEDKGSRKLEMKVANREGGDGDPLGGLGDVLKAIKVAPQGESRSRNNRKKPKR